MLKKININIYSLYWSGDNAMVSLKAVSLQFNDKNSSLVRVSIKLNIFESDQRTSLNSSCCVSNNFVTSAGKVPKMVNTDS